MPMVWEKASTGSAYKFGSYPSCAMMRGTRSLDSRLLEWLSLQVRDTVEGETPAAAATSQQS